MRTDVLQEQMDAGRAAIRTAVDTSDHIEATHNVVDYLMLAYPAGDPRNADSRNRWHVGSSAVHDDTGAVVGYTTCLAWTTAGIVTSAGIYVSLTGSVYSTMLGERSVPRHEEPGSDTPQDRSIRDVGWSAHADDRLDALATALTESSYSVVPARSATLALLDVAENRAAGFVGRLPDPAARLATSLLIAEAYGQVSDWTGRFPGLDDDSIVAGSHFTHYQSIARLLDASRREAAPMSDPREGTPR